MTMQALVSMNTPASHSIFSFILMNDEKNSLKVSPIIISAAIGSRTTAPGRVVNDGPTRRTNSTTAR